MSELFERKTKTFGYYINLDERGSFDADLRECSNMTIGQIVRMANGEEATQEASKSKAMRLG